MYHAQPRHCLQRIPGPDDGQPRAPVFESAGFCIRLDQSPLAILTPGTLPSRVGLGSPFPAALSRNSLTASPPQFDARQCGRGEVGKSLPHMMPDNAVLHHSAISPFSPRLPRHRRFSALRGILVQWQAANPRSCLACAVIMSGFHAGSKVTRTSTNSTSGTLQALFATPSLR